MCGACWLTLCYLCVSRIIDFSYLWTNCSLLGASACPGAGGCDPNLVVVLGWRASCIGGGCCSQGRRVWYPSRLNHPVPSVCPGPVWSTQNTPACSGMAVASSTGSPRLCRDPALPAAPARSSQVQERNRALSGHISRAPRSLLTETQVYLGCRSSCHICLTCPTQPQSQIDTALPTVTYRILQFILSAVLSLFYQPHCQIDTSLPTVTILECTPSQLPTSLISPFRYCWSSQSHSQQ